MWWQANGDEAAFSADGTRLYYRAVIEGGGGNLDIWWVESTEDGWGAPTGVGLAVNTDKLESPPSVSPDGRFLFFISGDSACWVDITPAMGLRPSLGLKAPD